MDPPGRPRRRRDTDPAPPHVPPLRPLLRQRRRRARRAERLRRPTAYGDLATALLAALALAALRNGWAGAVALVWAFNVVGFVDLGIAAVNAQRVDLLSHFIGTAYWLPILVVPLLLVTHVLLAWRMTGDRTTGVPVAAPTAG